MKARKYVTLVRRKADVLKILSAYGYKPIDYSDPKKVEAQLLELEEWRKVLAELNELLQGL